eukprot:10970387-Alexandrium_andersonii.AAC.1
MEYDHAAVFLCCKCILRCRIFCAAVCLYCNCSAVRCFTLQALFCAAAVVCTATADRVRVPSRVRGRVRTRNYLHPRASMRAHAR